MRSSVLGDGAKIGGESVDTYSGGFEVGVLFCDVFRWKTWLMARVCSGYERFY